MEQINHLPNQPIPQMPTNPPVSSSSPNKNILVVLIILFSIILSSLITYLLVKSKIPSQTIINSPSPTLSASPTPTPNPTANWKIYTNTQYKYSVKYPADYSVIETSSDYVRFSPGVNDPNLPQRETYLSIQLDKNPQQLPETVYKKTTDGKTLRISQIMMDVDENQKPQIKIVFDQILSTFKFD